MYCQSLVEWGEPLVGQERPDIQISGTEVLIKVSCCGVCHSDLHMRAGGFDLGRGQRLSLKERGRTLPITPGHEVTGVVDKVGPDAEGVEVGTRCVVYPWQGCGKCDRCAVGHDHVCDNPQFLGVQIDGGYATHVKVNHPRYVLNIGDRDPAEIAPMACSGLTAYSALKKVGDTLSKAPVVVIGAGGLGLMSIGLIKALGGLAPIVVDIDSAKRDAAIKAGASVVIDGASPNAAAEIMAATGKAPVAVIDFVGAETTTKLGFDVLGKTGRLVIVGLYGGASPWQLPFIPMKSATIMGSYIGSLPEFHELMGLVLDGSVEPLPTMRYKLDEANGVLDRLEHGQVIGRAILMP